MKNDKEENVQIPRKLTYQLKLSTMGTYENSILNIICLGIGYGVIN